MSTTIAAIIIGDEILSGKFADQNSPWLIQRCRELNLSLRHISIIPDDLDEIASTVARWSARVDYVLTTGGVGPTHDDLTMSGLARAFQLPLERHAALEQIIRDRFEGRLNEDVLRMADLPQGAVLWEGHDALFFPQVVIRNVLPFPGVPSLFQKKFSGIAHRFVGAPLHSRRLLTLEAETDIAARLRTVADHHPQVAIGSYPQFDTRPWTVTLTLDSRDPGALLAAEADLRATITIEPSE